MTSTRYFVCLVAQAFGYRRTNIRMGDAAGEMHLLKEAESHLGKAIWQKVEDIEELSVEYWNLRKLIKERDRVAGELEICLAQLAEAHEERASLLGMSNEPFQDLLDERRLVLSSLEDLARERDVIVAKARDIRRIYDGIKTKEEVLTKEGNHTPEELAKISKRLSELKKGFTVVKSERHEVAERISNGDTKIDAIDLEIQTRKKTRREKASEAFQHIGDANQEMSTLRAELGVLDTQMRQLYSEIGRHISRNTANNPDCRKACKEHQGLVDVMRALRRSVILNHKLAENG
jgi:chromosome segregation ATPase